MSFKEKFDNNNKNNCFQNFREVDIWAIGCLYSEMRSGDPLFPGESDIDQLFQITQLIGNLWTKLYCNHNPGTFLIPLIWSELQIFKSNSASHPILWPHLFISKDLFILKTLANVLISLCCLFFTQESQFMWCRDSNYWTIEFQVLWLPSIDSWSAGIRCTTDWTRQIQKFQIQSRSNQHSQPGKSIIILFTKPIRKLLHLVLILPTFTRSYFIR